jgi:phosphoesterase RecJ-like protein
MFPPAELLNFFRNEDDFLIATHMSPDGDALGSSLALSLALQKIGKKTFLLNSDHVPEQYTFLPGYEKFYTFENIQETGNRIQDFKRLVLIDCNDLDRVTDDKSKISNFKFQTSAVIDHHETEKPFGDMRWIMPDSPATGLMIFYVIKALGIDLSQDMAATLYAAIAVDTGNFRYSNTTSEVLRIAADLTDAGAIPHIISTELYESWSEKRFRLFIKTLDTLQIEDGIAITTVTRKMLEETLTSPDDIENFVSYPRIIKDIKVSVLLREIDDNYYKASLRSKNNINVARAAEAFGGGGHQHAAGFKIRGDFETVKARLIKQIKSNWVDG